MRKIPSSVLDAIIAYIKAADLLWADEEFTKATMEKKYGYYDYEMNFEPIITYYDTARQTFENTFPQYKDTPMYEYVYNLWLWGPLWDSARLG